MTSFLKGWANKTGMIFTFFIFVENCLYIYARYDSVLIRTGSNQEEEVSKPYWKKSLNLIKNGLI